MTFRSQRTSPVAAAALWLVAAAAAPAQDAEPATDAVTTAATDASDAASDPATALDKLIESTGPGTAAAEDIPADGQMNEIIEGNP